MIYGTCGLEHPNGGFYASKKWVDYEHMKRVLKHFQSIYNRILIKICLWKYKKYKMLRQCPPHDG